MSVTVLNVVSAINDATMLANALMPLLQRYLEAGRGLDAEVSPDDLAASAAGLGLKIDQLDEAIERARAREAQGDLL